MLGWNLVHLPFLCYVSPFSMVYLLNTLVSIRFAYSTLSEAEGRVITVCCIWYLTSAYISCFQSGPDLTTEETWGVNYRALRDLFSTTKERRDMIEYEVGVQMIEIYNEQVRDLLVIDGANRRYPLHWYMMNYIVTCSPKFGFSFRKSDFYFVV